MADESRMMQLAAEILGTKTIAEAWKSMWDTLTPERKAAFAEEYAKHALAVILQKDGYDLQQSLRVQMDYVTKDALRPYIEAEAKKQIEAILPQLPERIKASVEDAMKTYLTQETVRTALYDVAKKWTSSR